MTKPKLNGRNKKQRNTSASIKELPPWHWAYAAAILPEKNKVAAREPKK